MDEFFGELSLELDWMSSPWNILDKFHRLESISRWYFGGGSSNISLLLTFWWMRLRHFEHHTLLPVPFVSTGDVVCCVTLQNRCQAEGKWPTQLIFKEFRAGTNPACMHESVFCALSKQNCTFLPFPVFSSPRQSAPWGGSHPRLQTREL